MLARYEYDVFGAIRNETGTSDNTRKFTGKEYDSDVRLYYYGARYYDPYIGRFTQRDPAADGVNWYAYTHNNPLRFIDPDRLRDLKPHEKTAAKKIFRDMIDLEQASIEESGVRFSILPELTTSGSSSVSRWDGNTVPVTSATYWDRRRYAPVARLKTRIQAN